MDGKPWKTALINSWNWRTLRGRSSYPLGMPTHALIKFRLASARMKATTHSTSEMPLLDTVSASKWRNAGDKHTHTHIYIYVIICYPCMSRHQKIIDFALNPAHACKKKKSYPSAPWPPLLYGIQLLYPCRKISPMTRWCPESFGTWTTCARLFAFTPVRRPQQRRRARWSTCCWCAWPVTSRRSGWPCELWPKLLRYLEGTLWPQEELNNIE